MPIEVIEKSTGAKMSHPEPGQLMGTTLFPSIQAAKDWMRLKELTERTHEVRETD